MQSTTSFRALEQKDHETKSFVTGQSIGTERTESWNINSILISMERY